jgi:hypothetical protein
MKRKPKGAEHTLDYFFDRAMPEPNSGCWIWLNATTNKHGSGYGTVNINGRMMGAHRAVFEISRGVSLDTETHVCHRCDVSQCVNPDHLFTGTHLENMADCAKKGRNKYPIISGSASHLAKLTEAQAIDIARSSLSIAELAEKYGVSKHAVYCIRIGKTWSRITGVSIDDAFSEDAA